MVTAIIPGQIPYPFLAVKPLPIHLPSSYKGRCIRWIRHAVFVVIDTIKRLFQKALENLKLVQTAKRFPLQKVAEEHLSMITGFLDTQTLMRLTATNHHFRSERVEFLKGHNQAMTTLINYLGKDFNKLHDDDRTLLQNVIGPTIHTLGYIPHIQESNLPRLELICTFFPHLRNFDYHPLVGELSHILRLAQLKNLYYDGLFAEDLYLPLLLHKLPEIEELRLNVLLFSDSIVEAIIQEGKKIKSLTLGNLSCLNANTVLQILNNIPTLEKISLEYYSATATASWIEIIKSIQNIKNIKQLTLHRLPEEFNWRECLPYFHHLEHLTIDNLAHAAPQDSDVLNLITHLPQLQSLQIGWCPRLTRDGLQNIAFAIARKPQKLQSLILAGCTHSSSYDPIGWSNPGEIRADYTECIKILQSHLKTVVIDHEYRRNDFKDKCQSHQ
ncbi:MAG: hypothetical protein JWO53_1041 [Chlamydiia bacterium]|nr:hypothetical protein [Chlamydiia bacterium]